MRLQTLEIRRARLRCVKPFKIASGLTLTTESLVVSLTTEDGRRGLGEAVPKPFLTGETLEGCAAALRGLLWPLLEGRDPWRLEDHHRAMDATVSGYPAARAALDMALHDLLAGAAGIPARSLLGGGRQAVPTNMSIGICPPAEAAEEARRLIERGFTTLKLKVGEDPLEDLERVRAVRGAIGPEAGLRIDANEGWSFNQALQALSRMEPYRIELAEQPLPRWDLQGMARLRARTSIPLAADESVRTARDALRILELGAADILNLKLMKCGGLGPARQIVAIARAGGLQLMVGGMVGESRIAVSAAAALAAAFRFEYADLDADLLLADDLTPDAGLKQEGSARILTDGPGLDLGALDPTLLGDDVL